MKSTPPRYLSSTGKTSRIKFPKWYGQVNDCQSVWTQNTGLTHSFIFQNFVKRINKLNTRAQRNKNSLTSEEGTELRPLWDKCPSGICTWKSFFLLRAVRRINDKAQCGPSSSPLFLSPLFDHVTIPEPQKKYATFLYQMRLKNLLRPCLCGQLKKKKAHYVKTHFRAPWKGLPHSQSINLSRNLWNIALLQRTFS